ncbi:DEKNAAC104337 [Brettanomyces naardenensis]|uniref:DEKNAAC104337 n=1 Tax=Brettanomyces naardenensis TaxID=13370 RepID=A0A448YQM1_BRENA|nr:DEKNAAC104337 [Brettanomyces naardenensis]
MSALDIDITLNTGAKIPAVGFGTVCFDEFKSQFKDALKAALLEGHYRHIDTAWYYGTEALIGEVLQELFESGKLKREDIFVTTKVWPSFWKDPLKSLEKSLHDLRLDYVDLFLQHWPLAFEGDENGLPAVPKDAEGNVKFAKGADYLSTWKKMILIYKNTTKTRAIGVSNYTPKMLTRLLKETDVVPATNQVELHPHLPQVELVKFCKEHKIVVEAFSPLGGNGAPNLKIPLVQQLAKKYNVPAVDIIVNYHAQAGRVVLPRSQNVERIKKGFSEVKLTEKELAELDQFGIDHPKRFINDVWGNDLGFEHWGQ